MILLSHYSAEKFRVFSFGIGSFNQKQNQPLLCSGSGLYSGGLTWSIVLRCDDHTGIFTCDGCARDPYFYVPAETQSYVIKLSCSRKVLAASGD